MDTTTLARAGIKKNKKESSTSSFAAQFTQKVALATPPPNKIIVLPRSKPAMCRGAGCPGRSLGRRLRRDEEVVGERLVHGPEGGNGVGLPDEEEVAALHGAGQHRGTGSRAGRSNQPPPTPAMPVGAVDWKKEKKKAMGLGSKEDAAPPRKLSPKRSVRPV